MARKQPQQYQPRVGSALGFMNPTPIGPTDDRYTAVAGTMIIGEIKCRIEILASHKTGDYRVKIKDIEGVGDNAPWTLLAEFDMPLLRKGQPRRAAFKIGDHNYTLRVTKTQLTDGQQVLRLSVPQALALPTNI